MSTAARAHKQGAEHVKQARHVLLTNCPVEKRVTLVLPVQVTPINNGPHGALVMSNVAQAHKHEREHVKRVARVILSSCRTEKAAILVLPVQLTHTTSGPSGALVTSNVVQANK